MAMRTRWHVGFALAIALSAHAAHATPIVTASQTTLAVGQTVTLDLAFDAGADFYAGFLLTFEATAQLELISFTPANQDKSTWSADLAAGVFSVARGLTVDESGRFEIGQLTVRAVADGAALSLAPKSSYVTPSFSELPFHGDPLASTWGGAPATPILPPPPPPVVPPAAGGGHACSGLWQPGSGGDLDVGTAPHVNDCVFTTDVTTPTLTILTLVPEPAPVMLLLASLAALAWRHGRERLAA